MAVEETPTEPQDFVVVLAYTSTDGEIEESFGQLVQDVKAMYTFKQNVRVYAVVEESAKSVLALLERPAEADKTQIVLSYEAKEGDTEDEVLSVAKKLNDFLDANPNIYDAGFAIEPSAVDLLRKARRAND